MCGLFERIVSAGRGCGDWAYRIVGLIGALTLIVQTAATASATAKGPDSATQVHERPVSFTVGGLTLAGTLTSPESEMPVPIILILHGLSGERDGPRIAGDNRRLFQRTADTWSQCGIASLRFSTRGKGGSHGHFVDMTLEGRIRETQAAIAWIRQQPGLNQEAIGILGYSQGATIAAVTAGRMARSGTIKALHLWAPNLDPMAHYKKVVGINKLTRGLKASEDEIVPFGRFGFKRAFYHDVWHLKPSAEIVPYRGPIQLIYGRRDRFAQPLDAEPFLRHHDGPHEIAVVDGGHHLGASIGPDATDKLAAAAADWFLAALPGDWEQCNGTWPD